MPSYRIIVVEHTEGPKTGNIVEKVGTYNPRSKERVIDADRVKYWMSVGAQPSDTVHNMLISLGIMTGKKINVLPKFVEPEKPVEEVAPEAPKAAAVEEAPAEEAAPEVVVEDAAPEVVADSTSSPQAEEPKADSTSSPAPEETPAA